MLTTHPALGGVYYFSVQPSLSSFLWMLPYDDKNATRTDHFWGLTLMTFIWVKSDHIFRRKYFLISDGVLYCLNWGHGALLPTKETANYL